jgi:signal transduction histidine kinase
MHDSGDNYLDLRRGRRSIDVYVRIESELAVVLPFKIVEYRHFVADNTLSTWIHSLYFGFMGSMLIVNAIVGIRMRQPLNLYYCGFSSSIILLGLSFSGFGRQFFWPHVHWIDNVMLPLSTVGATVLATLFNDRYLFDGRSEFAVFRKASQYVVSSVGAAAAVASIIGQPHHGMMLAAACAVLGAALFMGAVFISIWLRIPHAMLLFFAWSGMILGVFVFVGRGFGVFPSNTLTTYILQIASIVESALLALAIIEKARYLRNQLEASNLEAQKSLEKEVLKRTTELKKMQQTIVEQDRKNALMVFAAGAAHEINNPVNFIAAGAQQSAADLKRLETFLQDILDDEAASDIRLSLETHFSECYQHLKNIEKGAANITADVSEIRKLNPEGEAMEESMDLVSVMRKVIHRLRSVFHPDIGICLNECSVPNVYARYADISSVFEALVTNAFEAMTTDIEQGVTPAACRLSVSARSIGDSVELRIEDNGPGVCRDHKDAIFEPFFTTKHSTAGAGLGLSVARDLVIKNGGSLTLDPVEKRGCCFLVCLPTSMAN